MRRRVPLTNLNPRDCRAPVPSGAGMGAATGCLVTPSPVSRSEEEGKALIWTPSFSIKPDDVLTHPDGIRRVVVDLTPATDPTANAPKKRGWPKGKKRGPKHAH